MRLLQDADQLVGCLALVCERAELLEDVLDQLHVVLPHSLELGFLKLLMGLGLNEHRTDGTDATLQYIHFTKSQSLKRNL